MLASRKLGAAAMATAATFLVTAGVAAAHEHPRDRGFRGPEGAVFVQNDNPSGNAITVYDRARDGSLTAAGTYQTAGEGGVLDGSVVDHLGSQDSLAYDAAAHELLAVNAGSNTISSFAVRGDRLRLRQVVGSGGQFPVSISVHDDLVYVLNALGGGTVQGYRLVDGTLLPLSGSSRALGLDPTAVPQFVNTPGDVAFSPDGRELLVTTKANTNAIDVFSINRAGLPSAAPVVNTEPGDVPFALAFQGLDQVDVGEAGTNAVASFRLHHDGTLSAIASVPTGGAATCWLVADGPLLFAGNAASATESSVLSSPFGGLTLTDTTSTDPGTVDAATSPDGRHLYVQTGLGGIVDEFRVGFGGSLVEVGSVTVPGAVGGEGIATS